MNENPDGDSYDTQYALDHEKENPADYWEFKTIIDLYQPQSSQRVLEIGCNTGEFCWLLHHKFQVDILGVDINEDAINRASTKFPHLNFQVKDLFELQGHYHVIYMQHVIEHLIDPLKALKQVNNLLDDEGMLIISCPNQWAYLMKLNCWIHGTRFCYDPTHITDFNPSSLAQLLNNAGFEIKKILTKPLGLPLTATISEKLYFNIPAGKLGGFMFMVAQKKHSKK